MHSSIILILLATRIVSGMSLRSVKTAILFDIDGTLCDSSGLCFDSTNIVLTNNGFKPIALQEYKEGSKYTTPRRFAWHVCKNPDDGIGNRLGDEFDRLYVALVSPDSVPLFPGIEEMLIEMKSDDASIMFGALTNACGAYARAIHACNPVLLNNFDICYGVDVKNYCPCNEAFI
jgi:phosphoglycolate phosphatase-like HAD superfamily hydrolase